jgi:hypothetical protein
MSHSRNSTQGDNEVGRRSDVNAGLFSSLKGIVTTLLTTGRTRLELLGNDFDSMS